YLRTHSTLLNEIRIVESARYLMTQDIDISPPPAIMRPRRIIPMMRRLPSGLIPAQFPDDDADAAKKPPTPYELAQKLARAKQPSESPTPSQAETGSDTDNTPTRSEEHTSELQSRF